jgi:hypothetical protein
MKNNHQRFVTYSTILLLACLSIPVMPPIAGNSSKDRSNKNTKTHSSGSTSTSSPASNQESSANDRFLNTTPSTSPSTSPSSTPSVSPSSSSEPSLVKGESKLGELQVSTLLPWLSGLLHITELAGLGLLFWLLKDLTGQHKEKTNDLQRKIAMLETSFKDQKTTFQSFNSELATVKRSTSRISDIDRQLSEQQIRSNASHQSYKQPPPQELSKPVPLAPRSAYPFLDFYRQNPEQFKSQYTPTPVSEVAENLQKRWAGDQQEIVLGEDRQGNYWLVTEGNTTYLIPNHKLKINDINMRTAGGLFDCGSYIPGYRSLNIIRPAIVSSLLGTSDRRWRLEQKGVLEFT